MAHQVAVPHYAGALASLVDGFTNNAMAIYEMGPAAASIEFFVLNWMLQKAGWEPAPLARDDYGKDRMHGGGVLTHGGSLANLTAMLMARQHADPDAWANGVSRDCVLLAPAGSHYSIARAASIMGMGQKAIRHLEVDFYGRILPEKLPQALDQLRKEGKRPMALVANACSTALGLYDPLEEIGRFCRDHAIWFHVDGAHGACALLTEKHKHWMKGIETADSLTWDAHKMLQSPVLCAALLARDHRALDRTFQQDASYLFHDKARPGIDFGHRTVECTKAGLGLKFFLVLGALGERGLSAFVDRQYDLASRAYEFIRTQPGFECAVQPQSNILCFRAPGDDSKQLAIRDALIAQGTSYLSSTLFQDKRYLRMALMNPSTQLEDVQRVIERIRALL
jgi:L-2,4-diaminobutyrate decarboxylase